MYKNYLLIIELKKYVYKYFALFFLLCIVKVAVKNLSSQFLSFIKSEKTYYFNYRISVNVKYTI